MSGPENPNLELQDHEMPAPFTLRGFFDFRRVNALRSLLGFALGAIIGLGIAGYGLLTSKGTSTHIVPPENVALVNQRPILRTDFIAQTETQYTTTFGETTQDQRLSVLDDMIREELFVQRGLELDFPGTDPDTRTALVAAVEQQVVADVTTHQPTDAELQKYYEDNRATYATEGLLTVIDLIAPKGPSGEAKAAQAVAALRAGTPPEEVKKNFGMTEQGIGDEQFYFAEKIHLGHTLFAKATTIKAGEVTDPIAVDTGVHVVKVIKNTPPVPLGFEAARAQVLNDFKMASEKKLEDADLRYLRGKAEILVADDYADAYKKEAAMKQAAGKK